MKILAVAADNFGWLDSAPSVFRLTASSTRWFWLAATVQVSGWGV